MQGCQAGLGTPYLVLLVLLSAGWNWAAAQVVPFQAPQNTTGLQCTGQTQCYLTALGAPQTQGEWVTAYMAALLEHCAAFLDQGNPQGCKDSVRCMFLTSTGFPIDTSGLSSMAGASGQSSSSNANFLADNTGNITAGSGLDVAYWKSVHAVLKLTQPACLPITNQLQRLQTYSCVQQRSLVKVPPTADTPARRLMSLCERDAAACFMANASVGPDAAAWWSGAAPLAVLEDNSSWRAHDKLQKAARACPDSWAAQDKRVTDTCATRGVGRTPWNQSLVLSRLVVAVMDAYESSGCNNTVTHSEAMAVQRIVQDLCGEGGCRAASGASTAAGLRLWMVLLLAAAATVLGAML